MSYVKNRRGRAGLGDVTSCGPDQVWDPNVSFYGMKGQCMPRANYQPSQLVDPNAIPGVVKSSGSSSGGASDIVKSILGVLTAPAPAAAAPVIIQGGGGMSDTTKLALGAVGALGLVLLLTRD